MESASGASVGLVVEPVQEYLQALPNKPGVTKINVAISPEDVESDVEIFYIPNRMIDAYALETYLKGCAVIGKYHQVIRTLNIKHAVEKQIVRQIPISKLLIEHKVRKIKHLKLDTEGSDCKILQNLLVYLHTKSKEYWPQKITFESNFLTNRKQLIWTLGLYLKAGYTVQNINNIGEKLKFRGKNFNHNWPNDTILVIKGIQ